MVMQSVNWLAVLVAGITALVTGGIWYSPALFGRAWMKENDMTVEELRKSNKGKIFGWSLVLSLVVATNLGMLLANPVSRLEGDGLQATGLIEGALAGFFTGVGVFAFVAVIGLYEHKTFRHILINGGYCILAALLMGAIIGAWR
ncbi:MAG: DUF1761 domain-containing protein [Pseudobacter sp.]|uniref:DUF1761 domain-containing protein n=1 Tax=Pseudobacter sp. TaxID=2045420 RepID=UPI003F819307